jgi:voltage-gated potassium channel Kch
MTNNIITKKLGAITKTLFTLINSLGIVFITIMIDAIINPSYHVGFIVVTLGILAIVPILGAIFYGLIDSCLCGLKYKNKIEWIYDSFIELFQIIIRFGVMGIGLLLITGCKANMDPKIGLAFMIIYITVTLSSAVITLMQINKYYNMLNKINH